MKLNCGLLIMNFNEDLFKNTNVISTAPLDNLGVQVETIYQKSDGATHASQPAKVITMDFFEEGRPFGISEEDWNNMSDDEKENHPINKLVKNHDALRSDLVNIGYEILTSKLGLIDKGDGYEIEDVTKLQKTILSELERRELSDNAIVS